MARLKSPKTLFMKYISEGGKNYGVPGTCFRDFLVLKNVLIPLFNNQKSVHLPFSNS